MSYESDRNLTESHEAHIGRGGLAVRRAGKYYTDGQFYYARVSFGLWTYKAKTIAELETVIQAHYRVQGKRERVAAAELHTADLSNGYES